MKISLLGLLLIFITHNIDCSAQNNRISFHISSSNTSFPDTGRSSGHVYDHVLYTLKDHYSDSTVLIVAPKNLRAKKIVDLVFWFHGWGNNVDSAAIRYQLSSQFLSSNCNAVLIMPETARNAPDSYGGKLENPGVFNALVSDAMKGLKKKGLIGEDCKPGHILLGGHSGAYRVMARIIQNGAVPVNEVMLFDALYAETEKFITWIEADHNHRFINLFTNQGGTDGESHNMMKLLNEENLPYMEVEEKALTPRQLQDNQLVFIHSLREHNDIINQPDNFKLLLDNSPFLKQLKVKAIEAR